MARDRNYPCPCGSGLKYKRCCEGKRNKQLPRALTLFVGLGVVVAVGVAGAAFISAFNAGAPAGRVWSVEHGHAKLRSYAAAHRTVIPGAIHDNRQYANNRAEVSHPPTRQRERSRRRFKSPTQAQGFLTMHGLTQNLFRVGRYLLQAVNHRILRARAFLVWHAGAYA